MQPTKMTLFRTLLMTICIVVAVFASVDLLAGGDPHGEIVNGIILFVAFVTAVVMSKGQKELAVVTFGWGILGCHYRAGDTDGNFANTTLFFYPVVILMSGWLLGLLHGYSMCLATIAAILGIAWMESSGVNIIQFSRGPWEPAYLTCRSYCC